MARREPTTPPLGGPIYKSGFARGTKAFDTLYDLKRQNTSPLKKNDLAVILGYDRLEDGRTMYFRYDPSSNEPADDINYVNPNSGDGQWVRIRNTTQVVEDDFVSYSEGELPDSTGAVAGTIGAYLTNEGAFQKIIWNGNEWEDISDPIATQYPGFMSVNSRYPREYLSLKGGISTDTRRMQPMITFTHDDSRIQTYDWVFPEFQSRGIVGFNSVPTNNIGNSQAMGLSELQTLSDAGWEIGSETLDHVNLTEVPLAEADRQLRESWQALNELGFEPRTLVYPEGGNNEEVRRLARSYYRAAFWTSGGVNYPPYHSARMTRFSVDSSTLEECKSAIDEAIGNNGWVIFMCHPGFVQYEDQAEKDRYIALLDYAVSSGADIVTPKEGMDRTGNILDVSDEEGNYFRLSGSGKLASPWVGDAKIQSKNANSVVDPITDYPENQISYTEVQFQSDWPSAGLVVTFRKDDSWARQWFYYYNIDRALYRRWDGSAWTEWAPIWSSMKFQSSNPYQNSDPITDYPSEEIHYTTISSDHINGFPRIGLLVTYRPFAGAWAHQFIYGYKNHIVEHRWWDGSNWSAWQQVAGGATGSFTAQSGETVTVENGIITSIS